jgi:hypothetical protein
MNFTTLASAGKSALLLALLTLNASAGTLYVDLNSTNPVSPYSDWSTAATNIQNAVDAASTGDLILVNDGIYQTGGRVVYGAMSNRVAVTKAITVRSVNGPSVTMIMGYQVPGTTNGDAAVRCVYLGDGALLSGFTLTHGATRGAGDFNNEQCGGGIWCTSPNAVVTNCQVLGNSTAQYGGGAYQGAFNNCQISGNTAAICGGGVYLSTLTNCTLAGNFARASGGAAINATLAKCTLTSNSAQYGGGASGGTLSQCTLSGNFAEIWGGGVNGGALDNCVLTNNRASAGGGAFNSSLNNCILAGNSARYGGGAEEGTLNNCGLTANSASSGGGSDGSTLFNCTLTGNSASLEGGGSANGTLNNCIVYFNHAPISPNASRGNLTNCCTTPLPASGVGNLDFDPQLADFLHLSAGSPCRGAGSAAYATGVDIDGEHWAQVPSIGCDEFYADTPAGPLSLAIQISHTNVAVGFQCDFVGNITGHASASVWDFGDGTTVSNRPYASHAWTAPGLYPVVLQAYNGAYPGGVSTSIIMCVVARSVHYVSASNTTPMAPYTSWAAAATNIQDAVDSAWVAGDLVLVSNGLYGAGGRAVAGFMTNRVAVTVPLVLQSLNGPDATVIQGSQVPATTNGDGAVRCAYLTGGSVLSGFALTNGATRMAGDILQEQCGGGLWSVGALITNCILAGNAAFSSGAGVYGGALDQCTLAGNVACTNGGGSYYSALNNCTLMGNAAWYGGGAYAGTLTSCTLLTNRASDSGGGTMFATLNQCWLSGNSATNGGGTCDGILTNCTLTGNSAYKQGGGGFNPWMYNCILTGNSAMNLGGGVAGGFLTGSLLIRNSSAQYGGGAYYCSIYNCTLANNSAGFAGGGADEAQLMNSIVFLNQAVSNANYIGGTLTNCCTTPLPSIGSGNLDADPLLASFSHLSLASPCRGAGAGGFTTGTDIDGEPWASPPSIGCDEVNAGSVTGAVTISIDAAYTNIERRFSADFAANIVGRVYASVWDFGDGTIVSNHPWMSHGWAAGGDYPVVLRAYSDSYPSGLSVTTLVHVIDAHYVALDSATPQAPFSSWATAATNIQDAVDAATTPGALVLVSNGVYGAGGRTSVGLLTNRLVIPKPMTVQSVNGPEATVIQGYQVPGTTNGAAAIRCAWLTNGATLSGFTISNGATFSSGNIRDVYGGGVSGGSLGAVVTNCIIWGNAAGFYGGGACSNTLVNCTVKGNTAFYGGGAFSATLYNVFLVGNSAAWGGGAGHTCTFINCNIVSNSGCGVYSSTLTNCTLTYNTSQTLGAGAYSSTLRNCIAYDNLPQGAANTFGCTLYYCCTAPLPSIGVGNFTNVPLFVDQAGGNLRLQAGSPCINAGLNASAPAGPDLDGNPRISGGTVDVGAYELQNPASIISYAWLQQYGLPTDGTADTADSDLDGMNNWQEWRAGSNPTNTLSFLQMLAPTNKPSGISLAWQSVTNRTYFLQRSLNLSAQPAFFTLQSNIAGKAGTTTYTDSNAVGAGPFFYRVGVQ